MSSLRRRSGTQPLPLFVASPYTSRLTSPTLSQDRTWLIIDAETKQFQTARQLSRMLLIHPHIDFARGALRIDVPLTEKGKGTISVETPLEPTEEQLSKMELVEGIKIWISEVNGYAVSKEADEALSEVSRRKAGEGLVYHCRPKLTATSCSATVLRTLRSSGKEGPDQACLWSRRSP